MSCNKQLNIQNPIISSQGKVMKIILSILIFIIAIVFLAFYFTKGISGVAREQLEAIRAGDITTAYSFTSKAFQNETSVDKYTKFIDQFPILRNYQDVTFTERKVENGFGSLNGIIEGSDGSKMKIEFQLVKENDTWKIQAEGLSAIGVGEIVESKPASSQMANDDSGTSIHDILINDAAGSDGYVSNTKTVLSNTSPKIFATIQIISPKGKGKVEVTLVQANGEEIGPLVGEISQSGNIMKAFSFTRSNPEWPKGKYKIIVKLSSGANQTISFKVK